MCRELLSAFSLAAHALACQARSTEPVGPSGWTARSWIGLCVQIALFILALWGICRLAGRDGE